MAANRILFRLFLLPFLVGALAHSTLVPRMTLEQAVDDSALIVQGTVVRTWSAWGDKRQFIWTHYEFIVSDALKGLATRNIVISEPGGIVGDTGMQIAGSPRYSVGEEVVLFATRTPIGYLRTAGWGQGKYVVVDARDSDRRVVRTSVGDITLVDPISKPGSPPGQKQTVLGRLDGMELTKFKERVRQLVVSGAAKEVR